jgi:hypothetical protein
MNAIDWFKSRRLDLRIFRIPATTRVLAGNLSFHRVNLWDSLGDVTYALFSALSATLRFSAGVFCFAKKLAKL